jgi:hypothetical protein
LLAKNLNANARVLSKRGACEFFASKLAPTKTRRLYLAEQQQHQQNNQYHTQDTRRSITPVTRVREHRQATDQQEDQDNRWFVHVQWDALPLPTLPLRRKFIVFIKHFDALLISFNAYAT